MQNKDAFNYRMSESHLEEKAAKSLSVILKELGESRAVNRFLSKYGPIQTKRCYAVQLAMYFKWLNATGVKLSPDEVLKDNLVCISWSDPTDVDTKRRHTDWLNTYVNDCMVIEGHTEGYRRLAATVIRKFYERNDSQLFGDFQVANDQASLDIDKPLLADDVRKVLKLLPLNVRLPYLLEWQSGMEIGKVLRLRWKNLEGLERGESLLKVSFGGRKTQKRPYYTYLGRDSVEALRYWRAKWAEEVGREPAPDDLVFLGKGNRPFSYGWLSGTLKDTVKRLKAELKNSDLSSWHTHSFRKSFKTEAQHSGAKTGIVEFFLGHTSGLEWVYNHADEVHEEDFASEYKKLEPYVSLEPSVITIREEYTNREEKLMREFLELRSLYLELKAELQDARSERPSQQSNA